MSVGEMSNQEIQQRAGRRVLANGTLLDTTTGKIVGQTPHHPASTVISTSERAKELAHTRWHGAAQDAYRRKVQEGLAGRGDSTLVETIEQARGEMIGVLVEEVVLNPDVRGIDRIKAHEHALEQSGMDGRAPKLAANAPGTAPAGSILDVDALERVVAALAQAKSMQDNT